MHGSALNASGGDDDVISVLPIGEDERDLPNSVPRNHLTRIIRPRVEETLEMIRDRLERSGFAGVVGKRIVLTGGASQLNGLGEVARRIFARNVRLGRPLGMAGLPESAKGPAFSAAVGLLIYPQMAHLEQFSVHGQSGVRRLTGTLTGTHGPLGRLGSWLRESF